MAGSPNPFTAENPTLQDAFSAVYYSSIPPSLIAARAQELGFLLFGISGMKHFQASENGHFSYKDPSGFAHPFLRVPSNEAAVIAIWEKWSEKKNEQIERHFHKANYKIPPLFGGNLQLRSIEPVFAPLDTSSITTALDSQYPQYWKLFFQIELPALELKRSSKLWQDLKEGGKTLADYMEILRPEALETILKLTKKTVVQGESVTVYIGKQHDIIQMEYQHLPILDRQPTDLLVPVNLQAEGIFRTPHSGTQAVEDSKLAGISMLHRRHSETQEVTPFWNGGGAASGRGSEGEGIGEMSVIGKSEKATNKVSMNIWLYFEKEFVKGVKETNIPIDVVSDGGAGISEQKNNFPFAEWEPKDTEADIYQIFTNNNFTVYVDILESKNELNQKKADNDFTVYFQYDAWTNGVGGTTQIGKELERNAIDVSHKGMDGACFVSLMGIQFEISTIMTQDIGYTAAHELCHLLLYRAYKWNAFATIHGDNHQIRAYYYAALLYCNHHYETVLSACVNYFYEQEDIPKKKKDHLKEIVDRYSELEDDKIKWDNIYADILECKELYPIPLYFPPLRDYSSIDDLRNPNEEKKHKVAYLTSGYARCAFKTINSGFLGVEKVWYNFFYDNSRTSFAGKEIHTHLLELYKFHPNDIALLFKWQSFFTSDK